MPIKLTSARRERYLRNILLREIGAAGQQKLLRSRALIVGAGGLGSPAALYLAAAGVGTIGIIDPDRVRLGNLQRQVLYRSADVGKLKAEAAKKALEALNPDVSVEAHAEELSAGNALRLVERYDFVLECSDNFRVKFLVADACYLARKPCCHAGVREFEGTVLTVLPGANACYRCVFEKPPAGASRILGVAGFVPAVLGAVQAAECVKFLVGAGDLLAGRLLHYNALKALFRVVAVKRNPGCALCGVRPTITSLKIRPNRSARRRG